MEPDVVDSEPDSTRYFVAKCASVDALRRCVSSGKWACRERVNPPQPQEVLTSALKQGRVVLLFSVNNCHGWHGYCCLTTLPAKASDGVGCERGTGESEGGTRVCESQCEIESGVEGSPASKTEDEMKRNTHIVTDVGIPIDSHTAESDSCMSDAETFKVTLGKNHEVSVNPSGTNNTSEPPGVWHHFHIEWRTQFITEFGETCLTSVQTQNLLLPDGSPLNKARNWQEVSPEVGHQVCRLLDDFYRSLVEKRAKAEEERLAAQPPAFLRSEIDVGVPEGPEQYWRYVVQKVEGELGRVHLACPFGSQRYNLQQAGSDIDAFIIYQAHTKDILGFTPPRLTLKNSEHEVCDYTVLELQRYCELLLAGDPRCVETLFLHDSTIVQASSEWRKLQDLRQHMLTRKCLDKYLSDALGSNGVKRLQRWRQDNRDVNGDQPPPDRLAKLMYIVIRLLQNALDIVKGRPLCVFRPDGSADQQTLRKLRRADISVNDIETLIQGLQDEIDSGKDSVASDTSEMKQELENWLLALRFCDFQTYPPCFARI
ncbi:hypothetical protein BaRGS_00027236 [Batillaria attramentaria]|uniref:YTH domain-containing protein n=1 Tax=Batillaria attramentaria TaxID=370345 RepID=A0ABD0K2K7_9CAEN